MNVDSKVAWGVPVTNPPTRPSTRSVDIPNISAPTIPPATFQQCKMSMIISDLSRDNQIDDSTAYIRFLDRMSPDTIRTAETAIKGADSMVNSIVDS
jgi:hypothetical protein